MQTDLLQPLSEIKRAWIENAAEQIVQIFSDFTTDDLHEYFAEPMEKNWWGVLMAKLKNEGKVERIGYKQSNRKSANGRVVAVWRVKP